MIKTTGDFIVEMAVEEFKNCLSLVYETMNDKERKKFINEVQEASSLYDNCNWEIK